ncbi:MAG: type II toxin-antitoxin system VapC family toxin [Calditrichaeota bacterium]|nr:MAG: type II toxin-antitoxin system VapC family toxin [Calditrichota bacterium]MBL1207913.1 type II toxin-antitoxin system VapC family toxin [Calditrichota bacterium]NOG47748.1 type II toxin-antitoxin system VapC family toxin [Calditrichota bacterium]
MKQNSYLLDTHALLFWVNQSEVSGNFIKHFDNQQQKGNVAVSAISFWEIALLVKKKRIKIGDVQNWKNELFNNTNLRLINIDVSEMITSTTLPDFHKDPFDRLLIAQAKLHKTLLVTKDKQIQKYDVQTFWME